MGDDKTRRGERDPVKGLELLSSTPYVTVEKARWVGRAADAERVEFVLAKRLTKLALRTPGILERFEREGEMSARLDHPNVARLLYRQPGLLVYEFIEGTSLAAALARGPFPTERALAVARGVLAAVAHAHGRGVIHLDLKPTNVMLETSGRVRVIDFGSAKDLTREAITQLEDRLGTPHYMAPEQFRGERSDPRSDVYSVGAVLYEILVGRPPFAHDPFGWLTGRGEPPEAWPEPPALAAVLRVALEREPERRYGDALEMLAALEGLDLG